ncbi:putative Zn-finger containing protein [Halovivax ruber XH-70]|uniref:Putative Zn-finger containing protein n=1 Tax=Halovivax ruber (strain DSM 18193 / JCM 13892 / XH-70) TaxID=797302 RepID=L0IHL7_HALRX|nr:Sjogren's syndrome/scleroderma autoantigen 1 family protein [Halovivax ruber]AGB17736.1 putative Zn-finger containing protein [Halovivax ruber XH-70]
MSETEDDDGGIDKEALREELREKYEEDDTEREATQRMSDLLLKGATMTNSHCDTCGDPLFQQNGATFCPSCHGGPEGVEASANGAAAGDAPQNGTPDRRPEPTSQTPNDSGTADEPREPSSVEPERQSFDPQSSPTNPDAVDTPDPSELADPGAGATGGPSTPPRRTSARPADGDATDAATSLRTALERFAHEAATTDDPRYARECLEAANEAAETLETLQR